MLYSGGGEEKLIVCHVDLYPSGAVMFLFEGTFGNILHTGDCRLTPECLQKLPVKYLGPKTRFDYVFLDCTFGAFSSNMPSKHVAIRQVVSVCLFIFSMFVHLCNCIMKVKDVIWQLINVGH